MTLSISGQHQFHGEEDVFSSVGLNPQLFVNEVYNIAENLLDDCFDLFQQKASRMIKIQGTDREQHLIQDISRVKNKVQFELNKGLLAWENYCLQHCFTLPEGFTLPPTNEASDDMMDADMVGDSELDAEIESLRNKLNVVEQECAELSRELQTLDRQAGVSNHSAALFNEALEVYQKQSSSDLFQELISASSEFHTKLENFTNGRAEEIHSKQLQGIHMQNENAHKNGLFNSKMEELQQILEGEVL